MFLPKGEDGIAGLWGDPGIKGYEVCLSEYNFVIWVKLTNVTL